MLFLHRFIFWFFLAFVLPLSVMLAMLHIVTGNIPMLLLNLSSIALSVFNSYNAHLSIERDKNIRNSILAQQIDKYITGEK